MPCHANCDSWQGIFLKKKKLIEWSEPTEMMNIDNTNQALSIILHSSLQSGFLQRDSFFKQVLLQGLSFLLPYF